MTEEFEVDVKNGVWLCQTTAPHSFDGKLSHALAGFFFKENAKSIIDVGCGAGDYVRDLRSHGFDVAGIDGNPKTPEFCEHCGVFDLTTPLHDLATWDWALCLEVGEHIPPQFEDVFVDNLCKLFRRGIVLSWFPEDGHGIGHFNPRDNLYVKQKMLDRGFISDEMAADNLRSEASMWWFVKSLFVFRRP